MYLVLFFRYLTVAPAVKNFTGIRTFRVLRALRTISAVEGKMKISNVFCRFLMPKRSIIKKIKYFQML